MTNLRTYDSIGGDYMTADGGGLFGKRLHDDRRFWMAWPSVTYHNDDIRMGVMDDFGNLVETRRHHQQ